MRKWVRKAMASVCALAAVGSMAVTAQADDKEVTEISVMFPTLYEMSGVPEVQDAINAITEEKYGIKFDMTFISFGNLQQQINLALTSDEVDVVCINGLKNYYNNGQIIPLTEYFENSTDELKGLFTDEMVDACTINGDLYGLTHLVDFGHYQGLNIDEEIAAEYGIENMQHLTMEEADTFLAWCKENYPDRYPLAPSGQQIMASSGWTWDSLGDFIGVLPDCGQGSSTVESLMDNEDYIECANWARKWYQAGYVTADILSNTEAAEVKVKNKQAIAYFDSFGVNNVSGMIRTIIVDHWTDSGAIASTTYAINSNSKHKDEAWTAMEIMYTDAEVAPLLYDGIEGRDYVVNEDGTISYPEGLTAATVPYGQSNLYWIMPWAEKAYPVDVNGPTFFPDLIEFNKQGEFSMANGFTFDTTNVIDEYTACLSVLDKYRTTLLSGAVDVESTLETAREEFEAAGEDIVIAEKQKQLDEFLANKGE